MICFSGEIHVNWTKKMPILIPNYGFYIRLQFAFIKLHELHSKRIPDRFHQLSRPIFCWFMCFVQVGDMKLFYQFCQSKQKQFQVPNLYKTRKYTKIGLINLKNGSVLYHFSCICQDFWSTWWEFCIGHTAEHKL